MVNCVRAPLHGQKIKSRTLVVVYGLKTYDYSWLDRFYPAHRLKEEAQNRSISLRFLFPRDVPAFLASLNTAHHDGSAVFLCRGSVPVDVIESIEQSGFVVINPSAAARIAGDKRETERFLAERGYHTPALIEREALDTPDLCWPIVAKPRFGSRGTGVCLIQRGDKIPEGDYLFQEYIAASHGRDFRVFFAAGTVLAAVERKAAPDDTGKTPLVSNACTGGSVGPSPFTPVVPESVAAMTASIAESSGLWYGSIDYLYRTPVPDPEFLSVCELNAAPGFTALETEGGFNIAGALMEKMDELFFTEQLL